ncbi:hypothetical protein ANCCEY_06607 [Ancylostoma ceylanicum]|uniref:Protein phosphatase n=1 Tax=Ancylostoma ceylanicum TaxID=53326 RepID=A0A0D6LQJ6_9BILA|nr:hypothetical protein ANCCEY_06607 [Ancylostoma ceylanicum]
MSHFKDMQKGPSTVLDSGVYGDDACFISRFKNTFVVGVADGVGGWRKYGIDPSQFSRKLMRECEKRVNSGDFDPKRPETLLEKAFKATAESPRPVGYRGFIGDTPDLADKSEIRVQKGDIVLLATDGLWDNLTEQLRS